MKIKYAFGIFFILLLAMSCSKKENASAGSVQKESRPVSQVPAGTAWPALALLETGENPLWFELGPEGPGLIESPAEAGMAPYVPWPNARFVIDMEAWEDFLVMAVNRDGFYILGPVAEKGSDRVVLYRVSGRSFWNFYTAESFFIWKQKPAVLLYRNDFFEEPTAPPLTQQVYILEKSSPVPLETSVPAFENFPSGWEAEAVRKGPDSFWFYRIKDKNKADGEILYFRTADLAETGEKISVGEWRNSNNPEKPEHLPRNAAAFLSKTALLGFGGVSTVKITSPDFEGPCFFALDPTAGSENPELLYAFFREKDNLALAILPDGRGFFSGEREPEPRLFSLPPLPEDFVYTGISVFRNILVASWEEQQDAGIGAAGFMVMKGKF